MLAAVLLIVGSLAARAQPTGNRTTSSGVFTAEQAKSGELIFQSRCAACHGAELIATTPEAPDLSGDGFRVGWLGKSIANRFLNIRNAMPPGSGGSLDDQTYLGIVAYILSFNGIPSGSQKLEPDLPTLEQIVIAKP